MKPSLHVDTFPFGDHVCLGPGAVGDAVQHLLGKAVMDNHRSYHAATQSSSCNQRTLGQRHQARSGTITIRLQQLCGTRSHICSCCYKSREAIGRLVLCPGSCRDQDFETALLQGAQRPVLSCQGCSNRCREQTSRLPRLHVRDAVTDRTCEHHKQCGCM